MYIGTTTMAAPQPNPEMSLPKQSMGISIAKVSMAEPRMNEMVVARIVRSLPYLLQLGPALRAPMRPPRVKMDVTTENCGVFMGIQ